MKTLSIYGIGSNLDYICKINNSKAFKIEWVAYHIDTVNTFMKFIVPCFENVFRVIRFEYEEGRQGDSDFTKLFKKLYGKWKMMVDYECKFCKRRKGDRTPFKYKLEEYINKVMME